jgi:Cu(I)/Ag(I) efflux system membrane fusion protein
VLHGLSEGETIVLSGQFMLDSESRLKEAIAKMLEVRSNAAGDGGADLNMDNMTMEGDDLNMQDMTMDSDGAAKPPSPGKEKQP